jgi:hypothetical protein
MYPLAMKFFAFAVFVIAKFGVMSGSRRNATPSFLTRGDFEGICEYSQHLISYRIFCFS